MKKPEENMTDAVLSADSIVPGEAVGFPNARDRASGKSIEQLAHSIEENGLINKLIIWHNSEVPEKERKNVRIGGTRRMLALSMLWKKGKRLNYKKEMPVRIFTGTRWQARMVALADNVGREDITTFEIARECAELRKEPRSDGKPTTLAEIAEHIGKSTAWVSRAVAAYDNATPALLDAWKKNKLSFEIVQNLATIKDTAKQEKALEEALAKRGDGSKAGRSAARASAAGKARQAKRDRPSVKQLTYYRELIVEPPKPTSVKGGLVNGFLAGLQFATGEIAHGELPEEIQAYLEPLIAAREEAKKGGEKLKKAA